VREDCTLRLDDPVDVLLPELADMTVLADPSGPLEDTVAAKRPITLRDLLTFTLGTGMVPAEPGTVPIADALNALGGLPPDEWMRRLGTLPLVHQPGERWILKHDPGLAASPPVRYTLKVARSEISLPLPLSSAGN
jgi:CubicO group peptidase (beta-lactamase class C family)